MRFSFIRTLLTAIVICGLAFVVNAQQPQTQTNPPFATNAQWANGVAPGYAPTAGSGLVLNLSAGTAICSNTTETYAGGILTLTASSTNYIYLDTSSSCIPAFNTSGFTDTTIPVAIVTTNGSAIATGGISDVRTMFKTAVGGSGITALTGDVTATGPGSAAASVVKIEGGAIPASALFGGWNSSHQPTTSTTTNLSAFLAGLSGCTTAGYAYVPEDGECEAVGSSTSWPTSGDIVVSNATNSPTGLAPVNGDCAVGSGGSWTTGACGSGSSTEYWERQGIVISPILTDPSPQAQEPSAMWDTSPEVLPSSYHNVVKMAWTDGWSTTTGVGICFGESPDGLTPPTRISGGCPLAATSGYARSHLLPTRQSGDIVLLATKLSNGHGDIFTGTTMAGLTDTTADVIECGSNGSESGGTLASWMVVNTSGNDWTMAYECMSNGNWSTWIATSTTGYAGTYTKSQATPVIGDTGNDGPNNNCLSGSPDWFYYDGTDYWLTVHCGAAGGNVPTPFIYLAKSTDAITWTFETSPQISSQLQDEGIGQTDGQVANSWILPDLTTSYSGGNRTTLYYASYANGCPSLSTCGYRSVIKAATINDTLAHILANGSEEGSNYTGSPEFSVNGQPVSSQRSSGTFGLYPIDVIDSGNGNIAIQSGDAISTFLGVATTALSSYTDSSGSTYALYADSGTSPQSIPLLTGNGAAIVAAGTTGTYGDVLLGYTPNTADYRVSGTFIYETGTTALASVFVRANSGAATYYQFQCAGTTTNLCSMWKDVSGTSTQLGSNVVFAWAPGVPHTLSLQAKGTTLIAWIDGVAVITETDSAISAVGEPGFRITGGSSFEITNFVVTNFGAAAGTSPLSGMTASQVPIAATATTVTSSMAIAGSGAGLTSGPTSSTNADCVQFDGTTGQISDAGAPCGTGSGNYPTPTTDTASSSSELDFNSCITGSYDDYEFRVRDLVTSSDAADILVQISTTSGGGSWITTGYAWGRFYIGVSQSLSGGSSQNTSASGWSLVGGAGSTLDSVSGRGTLFNAGASNPVKSWQFQTLVNQISTDGTNFQPTAGSYGQTGGSGVAITAVRFLPSTGSFTSGSVTCQPLPQ